MMPRTIDDNGAHPGTPTRARKGVISPLIGSGLMPPYWGWQIIGREGDQGPEYHGVVSDSLGTIVWESPWVERYGYLDMTEATRSVAVHHNITGCPVAGCEYGKEHIDVEGWS